jgi:hypothetical protein
MLAAEKVRTSVREMTFDQWPFMGLTAFETFQSSECHPVVKAATLLRISQLNQETLEWALGEKDIGAKLQTSIKALVDLKLDNMPWMNPDVQASPVVLTDVQNIVKGIPAASELKKAVESQIGVMTQPLATGCRVWPDLPNHQLHTLAAHVGHSFRHHHAAEDAEAAGQVLLAMMKSHNATTPRTLLRLVALEPKRILAADGSARRD